MKTVTQTSYIVQGRGSDGSGVGLCRPLGGTQRAFTCPRRMFCGKIPHDGLFQEAEFAAKLGCEGWADCSHPELTVVHVPPSVAGLAEILGQL